MDINRVVISGRLTRDCEVRSTQSGGSLIRIGLAVNDRRRNAQTNEWEDRPNFVDCVMFDNNNTRAWMPQYLTKGFHVTVEGRLRYDSWDKDGQKRSRLEVVADNIDAVWPKRDQQGSSQGYQQGYQQQGYQQQGYQQQGNQQQGYQKQSSQQQSLYDEDTPF